jgi:ATP-binding cassette, subfamily B, bacterial
VVLSRREVRTRLWPLTSGYRGLLGAAAALLATAAAADTAAVWLFSEIVDRLADPGTARQGLSGYWAPAGMWAAVAVLGAVCTFAGSYLSARAAEGVVLRLRDRAFGRLQRARPAREPGDLLARLVSDVDVVESLVCSGLVSLVVAALSVVLFAGAALWISWRLSLVVALLGPLMWLLTRRFARRAGEVSGRERARHAEVSTVVQEGIDRLTLARLHRTEAREARRVHRAGARWRRSRLAEARLSAIYPPATDLLQVLGILGVLGVGAWQVQRGGLTVGDLVAFATYLGFLVGPLQQLGQLVLGWAQARAAAGRVLELLDAPPAVPERTGPRGTPPPHGTLVVDRVGFRYPAATGPGLAGVSATVAPGEILLVTGPSGAGKSTLARLLARLDDPDTGRITLGGVDLRDHPLDTLRDSITLLSQDTTVVTGSVAENIGYGTPGADPAGIRAAARAAGAEEFISRLPRGYDTPLRHGGPELSGGQRQRIALARAYLRDTPVLILDEPSTGLDPATVAALLPPLRALAAGRTTVLISHDDAFEPIADRVLRLPAPRDTGRAALALGGVLA